MYITVWWTTSSGERVQELYGLEYSEESGAVVALLHDLCKVGCYKKTFRNVKDDATGKWERYLPTSLTIPPPMATGKNRCISPTASSGSPGRRPWPSAGTWASLGRRTPHRAGPAKIPLAFALATADMEASYFLEGER